MPKLPNPVEIDFEEYIRHIEPSKQEKGFAWATAIGLQQVDGLTPSQFLYETAKRNIEGEISVEEVQALIDTYYESRNDLHNEDSRTEEADKVASRIAQILGEPSFNFSPSYFIAIHKRLFQDIYQFAGKLRDYDITKKEWVLDGDTVIYGAAFELKSALSYDFEQERSFIYENISQDEFIKHLCFFVSRLWQIHAFGEGNTRTTAVFIIKYLRSLGFKVNNKPFESHSWYFRNALVRANYKNVKKGIGEDISYLELFFRNLLLGEKHQLRNRYMHLRFDKNLPINTENLPINTKNLPINQVQQELLQLLQENPMYTYAELAQRVTRTRETVRVNLKKLQDLGLIKRIGANKNGWWQVHLK